VTVIQDRYIDAIALAEQLSKGEVTEAVGWAFLRETWERSTTAARSAFLKSMKLPGAFKERKRLFDQCQANGGTASSCELATRSVQLYRPKREAFPPPKADGEAQAAFLFRFHDSPLGRLLAGWHPDNPPASELVSWRENAPPLAKVAGDVEEVIEDVTDALEDTIDTTARTARLLVIGGLTIVGTGVLGTLAYVFSR